MNLPLTILRRSMAAGCCAAFALLIALHLLLRSHPWTRQWYWAFDAYHFVTMFLVPAVAGVAAWDAARWAGASDLHVSSSRVGHGMAASWVPTAVVGVAAYLGGLIVVIVIAFAGGAPGLPPLRVVTTVAPPVALLVVGAALGACAGWLTGYELVGAPVAVVVFAVLMIGYVGLPSTVLEVGGATGSLLAVRPRTTVQLLQTACYSSIAVAALAATRRHVDRHAGVGGVLVSAGVAVALTGSLVGIGGETFVDADLVVVCEGHLPEVCLAPGYEFMRDEVVDIVAGPFGAFREAGFVPPARLTQDVDDVGGGAAYLGVEPPTGSDVVAMLTFAIVPAACDIFRDEQTYDAYIDVQFWVSALIGDDPMNPGVSDAVAGGDTPAARTAVAAIRDRLRTCTF